MSEENKPEGLALLRVPFEERLIGKLPKPTKRQTEEVKADFKAGIRCNDCGGWHHPKVVHLDYVGHAALTDRLLDVDPKWSWRPMATDEAGLPLLDKDNLLWIELTILGVTRIGAGDAGNKTGGDAAKERIGDALRNAGMRFGAALDLWHKGDLHDNAQAIEKPTLTPDIKAQWQGAKDAFKRDGNLDKVLARVDMSPEHQAQLQSEVKQESAG
jgi:hypothetical protein